MSKYVAAIDQGTTSTRFIIFDHAGNIVAVDQKEHHQIYPKPGWVEHDPLEIWENTKDVMTGALKKVFSDQSSGISHWFWAHRIHDFRPAAPRASRSRSLTTDNR